MLAERSDEQLDGREPECSQKSQSSLLARPRVHTKLNLKLTRVDQTNEQTSTQRIFSAEMRPEGLRLLEQLGGMGSSFVSVGKASDAYVGVTIDPKALPRSPYGRAIEEVRTSVRSCAALPDLPPACIAVVYSKGSSGQKWYATPPCPKRAEKKLSRALEARGRKRARSLATKTNSCSDASSDSDYTDEGQSSTEDDESGLDDHDDLNVGNKLVNMAGELDRREKERNACTDELYEWAEGCSDDDVGYMLPGDDYDTEPTTACDGRIRYPEVIFDVDAGDNMLGMLITEEVRRRQKRQRMATAHIVKAPCASTLQTAAQAAAQAVLPSSAKKTKKRVPLQHLGVRDAEGNLVERAPTVRALTWYVDTEGRTLLGNPPRGCKTHGVVHNGVLVGR